MSDETTLADACESLEGAISTIMAYIDDEDMPVDAVLVIGVQRIDEDGDRIGGVTVFGRNGCQPTYITAGLLANAQALMNSRMAIEPGGDE